MRSKISLLLLVGIISISAMGQQNYDREWKQVRTLIDKGLPQSALQIVDSIYNAAREGNNSVQFLKASLYQVRLRSDYQEDYMQTSIAQVRQEIKTAEEPVKQVLHSILAELYWRYYQGNRMKFLDRTSMSYSDPDDIATWDLPALIGAVTSHYEASLEHPELLQNTALDPYDPILDTAAGSKIYRPTLFDFLAHRALDFFENDESSLTRPAEQFRIDQSAYFLPAADFAKMEINTSDKTSMKFRAVKVLQSLLSFHLEDAQPRALIDLDLHRLQFIFLNSILGNKEELYIGALKNLSEKYSAYPQSTDVEYNLAQVYESRGARYNPFTEKQYQFDIKKAVEICDLAINRFPGSEGARNCKTLRDRLTESEMHIKVVKENLPSKPMMASLNFKNIDKAYFRIVRTDPEEFRNIRQNSRDEEIIQQFLQYPEASSWEQELPNDGDFQSHRTTIEIPGQPKGYFVLLGSTSPDFPLEGASTFYTTFWVTGIGYIHNRDITGSTEIYVLDRDKGTPLSGVTAKSFVREYDYQTRTYHTKELNTYSSDKKGYIYIPEKEETARSFYIEFSKGDDRFYTENYFFQYREKPEPRAKDITYFFTDRAIYRPGQTIYLKGILLEKSGENYVIKPSRTTEVAFYDVNNRQLATLNLTTNEFGAFNGTFTAPNAVLTGQMQIRNESGRTTIRVEEYKRPKFQVQIDPLKGNYKLDQVVDVQGKAKAYAGNPIDGASVSYRVVRQVSFPYWRYWGDIWPGQGEAMEVTSGMTTTDDEGNFTLEFKAIPDLSIDIKRDPVFSYTLYVDVTDINGETHSATQSVAVSNKALYLSTTIPENLDLTGTNEFILHTRNLNEQPVNASGSINIYPLKQPEKVLRERPWERPDVFVMTEKAFARDFPNEIYDNEDDPLSWEKGEQIYSKAFDTGNDSLVRIEGLANWAPGMYLVEIASADAFGQQVTLKEVVTAFNPGSANVPGKSPAWMQVMTPEVEPGNKASFVFGTAERDVRVLYEIINKDTLVKRQWLDLDRQANKLEIPVEEGYRGNFCVRLVFVKGNRGYSLQEFIRVPYTNKELDVRMETFRDKLSPGQEEEWRLRIKGKTGDKVAADLMASMYDASLDVFATNPWKFDLYKYFNNSNNWDAGDAFMGINGGRGVTKVRPYEMPKIQSYDRLNWFGFNYYQVMPYQRGGFDRMALEPGMTMKTVQNEGIMADQGTGEPKPEEEQQAEQGQAAGAEVPVRRNFDETAFFYPDMKTDQNGDILLSFKVPESLTSWKFRGLAYTKDLMTGYIEKEVVTSKELMVVPNPPRFFREGDRMSFSSKVVNMAENTLSGTIRVEFFNALDMNPMELLVEGASGEKSFSLEKGNSAVFSWDISIPENVEAIVYKVVASSDEFSDGEEMAVPVLPNRMLVTETMPLTINGPGSKSFSMNNLVKSGKSKTIQDYRLTLEFTSNPAWYAVQALPYLMEEDDESTDGIFQRLYANSIASWIANSNPRIRQVFNSWKDLSPDALLSNLEKNSELKSVLLQETPWVLQARDENEQKQRIALLFDLNRMVNEQFSSARKLQQMQLSNGGWPWYKGMKDSPYITQNIISGIGRLQHMGVIDLNNDPAALNMVRRGVYYMDQRMKEYYDELVKNSGDRLDEDHLSPLYVQYLYGRSFFMDLVPVEKQYEEAFAYIQGQAGKYWNGRNKYMQGMIALALNRLGDGNVPMQIIKSLKENSLSNDELGMYWRANEGYFWYELPVERQAILIEAFAEVAGDYESVGKMQVWLLKQKQTQKWETGQATADAVYALLQRGANLLAPAGMVEVSLGNEKVNPFKRDDTKVEAGTGYYKTSWSGASIVPSMGKVKVTKTDEGIAWGALYWQYFEDLDMITTASTPLSLEKKMFREDNSPTGPVLSPIGDLAGLRRGDKVVVRIILKVDRDMEFVHMKDMRAAAFEPVDALSGYRYQGGLGYYEAPKDASMNFYFDYLRKGTYVFEYTLMATQKGDFSNGIATIQCQYAPEFSARSQGMRITIK